MLSCVWLFATPWTVAHWTLLSMGFPRQEYWSVLPFPPPGDLPNPGIKHPSSPVSPVLREILCLLSHQESLFLASSNVFHFTMLIYFSLTTVQVLLLWLGTIPHAREATKPQCHNYWACALEPVLRNMRSHCSEKPIHNYRVAPAHLNLRNPERSNEDPAQPKWINKLKKQHRGWDLCLKTSSIRMDRYPGLDKTTRKIHMMQAGDIWEFSLVAELWGSSLDFSFLTLNGEPL